MIPQSCLVGGIIARRHQRLAEVVAHGGLLNLLVRSLHVEEIRLVV